MENVVKLEVGQYWHHPTKGHEFIIEKVVNNCFESKCTRSSAAFRLDHNLRGFSENLKKNGYVLGRHPDNIAPQPEQWQPKEGDLVWNKVYENKAKIVMGQKGHIYYIFFNKHGLECISPYFERDREEFEPYTNQDKPVIDFSVAGQWLRHARSGAIVETNGIVIGSEFGYNYIGQEWAHFNLVPMNDDWQLLTPEQMQPILDEVEKLKRKV